MASFISRLMDQYSSLPKAVVLKTALLSLGLRFSPLLVEEAKTAQPDFRPFRLSDGTQMFLPYLMILEGGSLVRLRCRGDSPFSIDRNGDKFLVLDGGEPVASFAFAQRPLWHGRRSSDGIPLDACGLNQHGDMMVLNLTPACEYWTTPWDGPQMAGVSRNSYRCAYCGYGLPDDRSRALGQQSGKSLVPEQALQRGAEAVRIGAESGARHLYLTGGSMTSPVLEAERYLNILSAVREPSKGVYLAVGSQALIPERLIEFKHAGADGVCFNLEVWDRNVWGRVCPGKAKFVGRARWEDSLVEAVRVFGEDNVYSAFVIGAEMVLDNALSEPEAALKSNVEGVRWLLSRGIQPILSLLWPFVGTDLEGARGPDLHLLLRLYAAADQIRRELGKPFPDVMACKRCLYMQVEGDFRA